jgi:flagellar hook-length control protein FliK
MNIDKSFQLLTADTSKLATEEAQGPSSAESGAEFGELFDAELESQEQHGADSQKQTGQEIAALPSSKLSTTESQTLQNMLLSTGEQTESLVEGHFVDGITTKVALNTTDNLQGQQALQNNAAAADDVAVNVVGAEAEVTSTSNPWLQIITQSNDFKEILSQSSAGAIPNEPVVSSAETLLSKVLGVPMTEQDAGESAQTQKDSILAGSPDKAQMSQDSIGIKDLVAHSDSDTGTEKIMTSQPDPMQQNLAQAAGKPVQNDAASEAEIEHKGRVVNNKLVKLPAEKVNLQEYEKVDRPHASSSLHDSTSETAADLLAAGETSSQPLTQNLTQGATTAVNPNDQKPSPLANTLDSTTERPVIEPRDPAEAVSFEHAVPLTADLKSGNLTSPAIAAKLTTAQGKNGPQSFAEFQKAVNVAAAVIQKQQLMAEQTQSHAQVDAALQVQKAAELNFSVPMNHAESTLVLPVSAQGERLMASSGGQSGSFSGQQQQQATAQLFATKLNDIAAQTDQAPLNLLEPNAATQLKERVMFQINQKIQSAEIKLAPEELGSMQVKVQLQQDQLSVQFVVQQQGAKEALEQQLPRLKDMLAEQGIELTQGQVSQQREGADSQRQAKERNQFFAQGAESGDEPLIQQAMVRVSDRMVDYYA